MSTDTELLVIEELVKVHSPVVEPVTVSIMEREEVGVKKCCKTASAEVRCVCHCCMKTWSFSLNAIDGGCFVLSKCCLFSSDMAIGCNKCLETVDCD